MLWKGIGEGALETPFDAIHPIRALYLFRRCKPLDSVALMGEALNQNGFEPEKLQRAYRPRVLMRWGT